MSKVEALILKSAALARSSPQIWSEFLRAFHEYTDEKRDQCISSPIDALPVSQGRAQACRDLLRLFAECTAKADQIEKRQS